MRSVFEMDDRQLDGMMSVVDNAQIEQRHVLFPIEYLIEPRSLEQTTREYQQNAICLGRRVAEQCLTRAGLAPVEIDLIITVSCTGFMIPSLDAHLIDQMGFRPSVRRLPITELGCVAGAMALSRAWEFVRATPGGTVLIVAVELPSLTFQRADPSQANLISSILFGDGAAAAVVSGREAAGLQILAAETYTFPQSLDAMGFDLRDHGFHIVLSKDVPYLIREKIRGVVDRFLGDRKLTRDDMAAFMIHPGGQRLLMYVEQELGLQRSDTQVSWDVLNRFGNLSSATILFILDSWLTGKLALNHLNCGDYGLAAAFGPGFSAEMLLLRWETASELPRTSD
jgi:alkylresorcinol/alkylpyrone synthase